MILINSIKDIIFYTKESLSILPLLGITNVRLTTAGFRNSAELVTVLLLIISFCYRL